MKSSLVIITWNEIQAIKVLFPKINRKLFNEIIVIDGDSTDGTIEYFKKKKIPVYVQDKPGHGYAYILAAKKAKGDVIVFFSGDGNERPEDLPKMLKEIKKGYDMVIANRFAENKSRDATPIRLFGNHFLTFLVNLLFDSKLADVLNAFRAVNKKSFESLKLESTRFDTEIEMTIKMIKKGYTIKHFPTIEMERIGGEAKLKTFKDGFANLSRLIKERFTS